METLGHPWSVLFVDDGSSDGTRDEICALRDEHKRIGALFFSRNFGKEVAMTAGLDHAEADAVVIIDADLQDPPELIPTLVEKWEEGHDVVFAQRRARQGETWFKRFSASAFYRVVNRLSHTPIPHDTGDFRLLDRRAVLALRKLREQHRFMKGLFSWIGFRQVGVSFEREPRHAGHTKFSYWRLWNFALEGITSFSTRPLKIATYIGLISAVYAVCYAIWLIIRTLIYGDPVPGYPSMMVVILLLGGLQLMALGVIGEYLGRLFDESKQRPLYLIEKTLPDEGEQPALKTPS